MYNVKFLTPNGVTYRRYYEDLYRVRAIAHAYALKRGYKVATIIKETF